MSGSGTHLFFSLSLSSHSGLSWIGRPRIAPSEYDRGPNSRKFVKRDAATRASAAIQDIFAEAFLGAGTVQEYVRLSIPRVGMI